MQQGNEQRVGGTRQRKIWMDNFFLKVECNAETDKTEYVMLFSFLPIYGTAQIDEQSIENTFVLTEQKISETYGGNLHEKIQQSDFLVLIRNKDEISSKFSSILLEAETDNIDDKINDISSVLEQNQNCCQIAIITHCIENNSNSSLLGILINDDTSNQVKQAIVDKEEARQKAAVEKAKQEAE